MILRLNHIFGICEEEAEAGECNNNKLLEIATKYDILTNLKIYIKNNQFFVFMKQTLFP